MYARAVSAYIHGGDPYSSQFPHLMFVYSPLVLKIMTAVQLIFPGRVIWYAYLALACAATLCLPVLLSLCIGIRWLSAPVAIIIFSLLPGFIAEFSLLSGNVANLLYAMVLLALFRALRSGRWSWFYAAVILSGIIKPPMLAFLLFPLLSGYVLQSFISGFVVCLIFLSQRLFMPGLYRQFEQALYTQLVLSSDVGFGLFSKLSGHLRTVAPLLFVAGILAVLWYLRSNILSPSSGLGVSLLLVACVLVNPRLLGYDAQIAIVPGICLLLGAGPALNVRQMRILGVLVSVALLVLCRRMSTYPASLFLLAAFFAGLWQVLNNRAPSPQAA